MYRSAIRHHVTVAAALAFAVACGRPEPAPPTVDAGSRRELASGSVTGFVGEYGSHVWRGIPYAEPPTGERRWRAPAPESPWQGERTATEIGSPCPQFASRFAGVDSLPPGTPTGSEDCLTLDVYAPVFAPDAVPTGDERLPVMVWIHGGGNVVGYGGLYNGGHLAATQQVVVVTMNYRLGPFGWFRHAALRRGASADERSGNFGLLDIIRSLEWVRDNIAAFGGDPGRVTVFGESAGGRDVFSLLVSPRAAGLFHGAIAQSGRAASLPPALGENPVDASGSASPGLRNSSAEITLRLVGADANTADRAVAKRKVAAMSDRELAAYLRAVDPYDLLAAYETEDTEGLIDVPQNFADGHVLPRGDLIDRLADPAGYNRVPAIFGTNRDENKVFMYVQPRYVQRVLGVYPRVRDAALYDATSDALSGAWKVVGADAPASAIAAHGASPVWGYRWDWDEEASLLGADLGRLLGASHGFEIPFVFGHFELGEATVVFDRKNEPARRQLSDQMMSYWSNFAYTGAPGRGRSGTQPEWLRWDASAPDAPKFLVLDTVRGGGSRMSSDSLVEETVVARVKADRRLATRHDRCGVLLEVATFSTDRAGVPVEERFDAIAADVCDGLSPTELARRD